VKLLKKIGDVVTAVNDKIAKLASILIFPLVLVVVAEVFFRYILNHPTIYTYDLSWMLYAAFVFLGGGYALHEEVHVKADIIYNMLKERGKAFINLFCYPVFFFTSMAGLLYSSYELMVKAWIHGETSPYTSWNPPVGPIKTVLFISILVLTLQGVVEFVKAMKHLRKGGNSK